MPHTALLLAAKAGHNEVIALLINHGFDINRKLQGYSGNALHEAVLYGKVETARYLLQVCVCVCACLCMCLCACSVVGVAVPVKPHPMVMSLEVCGVFFLCLFIEAAGQCCWCGCNVPVYGSSRFHLQHVLN